eukprot:1271532-Prymnesium_polylepis.1
MPPADRAAAEEVERQRFMFMGINAMNITDVPAEVVLSLHVVAWHVGPPLSAGRAQRLAGISELARCVARCMSRCVARGQQVASAASGQQ